MRDKQRALKILQELFGKSSCLSLKDRGPECTKWISDFEVAVRHIFPHEKTRIGRVRNILNPPSVFRAGQGNTPPNPDHEAKVAMRQMDEVQAVLSSMMDEIRNFWSDEAIVSREETPIPKQIASTTALQNVFVVHGRDHKARNSIFDFLRSIKLNPLEWPQIVSATGKSCPYIGEVLEKGFEMARAVVVLLTPDDEARLKKQFRKADDPAYELVLTGQARPNVLFEAGMALGLHPDRTVLVELGSLRQFTDVLGRHVVRIKNSIENRQDLADRLRTAGCAVDLSGHDWHTVGDFNISKTEKLSAKKIVKLTPRKRAKPVSLAYEEGVYWKRVGTKKEGPFCQTCWDDSKRQSRLQDGDNHGGGHKWFCTVCHNGFGDGGGMFHVLK